MKKLNFLTKKLSIYFLVLNILLICTSCTRSTYDVEIRTIDNDSVVYTEQVDVCDRLSSTGEGSKISIVLKQTICTDTVYLFYYPQITDFNNVRKLNFVSDKPIYVSKYKKIIYKKITNNK